MSWKKWQKIYLWESLITRFTAAWRTQRKSSMDGSNKFYIKRLTWFDLLNRTKITSSSFKIFFFLFFLGGGIFFNMIIQYDCHNGIKIRHFIIAFVIVILLLTLWNFGEESISVTQNLINLRWLPCWCWNKMTPMNVCELIVKICTHPYDTYSFVCII